MGVIGAAILGTEKMILSRGRCLEINRGVAARNGFALHAESGNREAVKDILRNQRDLNRNARRNVQRVDFMLSAWVLHLPHPLLAHHVDLHGIGRSIVDAEVQQRAPDEKYQKDSQWDQSPCRFEQGRAFNLYGVRMTALAIADGEEQDHAADQNQTRDGHSDQGEIQCIRIRSNGGCLRREDCEVI